MPYNKERWCIFCDYLRFLNFLAFKVGVFNDFVHIFAVYLVKKLNLNEKHKISKISWNLTYSFVKVVSKYHSLRIMVRNKFGRKICLLAHCDVLCFFIKYYVFNKWKINGSNSKIYDKLESFLINLPKL